MTSSLMLNKYSERTNLHVVLSDIRVTSGNLRFEVVEIVTFLGHTFIFGQHVRAGVVTKSHFTSLTFIRTNRLNNSVFSV